MSSESPDEPQYRTESYLRSPASPTPIHFPPPAAIPVLEMQTDVGFNQTEPHMRDPASRNTEVRPNMWKDPNEQIHDTVMEGQEPNSAAHGSNAMGAVENGAVDWEKAASASHAQPQPMSISTSPPSLDANGASANGNSFEPSTLDTNQSLFEPKAHRHLSTTPLPNNSFPTQSNQAKADDPSSSSHPALPPNVDIQALLKSLQSASAASNGGPTPAFPQDVGPSSNQTQPYPYRLDTVSATAVVPAAISNDISPLSASGLGAPPSGLPPRPPPQDQPMINSDYAQAQQIHDFHAQSDQGPMPQRAPASRRPEDRSWDAEVQRKYDDFVEEEKRYVAEGRWEQFPQGSRLFVGNLNSERVTKRDVFYVFYVYGDLAQISIKQAYGFVQFLRSADCRRALDAEQGTFIRDKRIHLEISKPQKNRPSNQSHNARRSRSPVHHARGRGGAGTVDRYVSGGGRGDGRGAGNGRDGYRPDYRSPSPRGYRDRYDDRYNPRSRSPNYNRGGGRYRSPVMSPRRSSDDDLALPRRAPREVPDVQILVLDSLSRDFISWIEGTFASRGVRVDVLLLSPRLNEQAVIRRQIVEGVVAVVKLTQANQNSGKIGLQIFDRSGGVNNVKFEEYASLDPAICAELVLRAKTTGVAVAAAAPPTYATYGAYQAAPSNYMSQNPPTTFAPPVQPHHQTFAPAAPPNVANLITGLDPGNLQALLSVLNQPQQAPHAEGSSMQTQRMEPELGGYLQQPQLQPQHHLAPNTGATGSGAVDMQEILKRLGQGQY